MSTFTKIVPIVLVLCIGLAQSSHAQSQRQLDDVKLAMKAGSSKELVKFFSDMIEINISGSQADYSKNQAEFVIRDFFKKNTPVDFEVIHKGESKDGLRYAIATYKSDSGNFRVLIRGKLVENEFKIYNLDFTKE
ncbi:DUF4783 domain-containing protein [Penaeicola halotolerans]|uniref:DUF4783 domain-containing protein n=1 Tax=Penaeicola halotolerans TaxID=2793196 RepID=UPI001CF823A2|nr:DUF4783 domain-containing protein [Penaeicola halotolerans]